MGAGKSTALELLQELGAAVLSTDAVVHELYEQSEMRAAVTARWGEEVAPEGAVDRAAIAQRAFSSEEDRRWLEDTLWPLVGARVAAWLADVRDQAAVLVKAKILVLQMVQGSREQPRKFCQSIHCLFLLFDHSPASMTAITGPPPCGP